MKRLHEAEPREQVGSATGARYEFQYHQAAADALQVLDDTAVACVYCEWHDDYVLEAAGVISYKFHQVKTRAASKGPWRLHEFLGVPSRKSNKPGPQAATDSIFARFYEHQQTFTSRCDQFVFVTDAGITDEFEDVLEAVRDHESLADLPDATTKQLEEVHSKLVTTFPDLAIGDLFAFFRRLRIKAALGTLANIHDCRVLIGGKIWELSEVDLSQSQTQKIGAELVAAVREKSHRVLDPLPADEHELRQAKGLVIDDILAMLSLSTSGYRELKTKGRATVVALSRLHRLLERSQIPASEIPALCRLKAGWDAWWVAQRHVLNELDVISLKKECADALTVHAAGTLDFKGLRRQASAIQQRFESVLLSSEPLTDELVFGLMLSIAVEAEQ